MFDEPIEAATRFKFLKLVNKNIYYTEKGSYKKLYKLNIFDFPQVDPICCFECEGDIIHFEVS